MGNGASLGADRPFCFFCGYDLSGLELPRPCPECGHVRHPSRDEAAVRKWFAAGQAGFRWIPRPSKSPAGICYVLDDPGSRRVARRRRFRWLWLPAVLACILVSLGLCVTTEYDVEVWYYDRSDSERTPLRVVNETETDRLYGFNLHLFRGGLCGLFFSKPASWVEVVERQRKHLAFSAPEGFDPMLLFWGCPPWFCLIFGYLPAEGVVLWRARWVARSHERPGLARAVCAASSLMAPPLGTAVWLWLGAFLIYGLGALIPLNAVVFYPVAAMLSTAFVLWVLALILGYSMLMAQDRARIFVINRFMSCVVLLVIAIGGPATASWAVVELLL